MRGNDLWKARDRRRTAPGIPAGSAGDPRQTRRLRRRADDGRAGRSSRDERSALRAPRRNHRPSPPESEPAPERGATPRRRKGLRHRKETFVIRKVLALTLSLLAFPLAAQEAGTPEAAAGVPLSLADATARALARNHDIAFERDAFRITDATVLRAEGSYDPSFHLDARYRNHTDPVNSLLSGAPATEISPSAEGFSTSASIGQLLPTGGVVNVSASGSRDLTNSLFTVLSPAWSTAVGIDLRQPLLQGLSMDPARRALRFARIDRERGSASLRRTVTDTVASVERAYWSLVAARRDVLVRTASVKLAGDQRDDTKTKIDVGTLAESEIAQPVAELERRKGDLYASQESVRRAELLLKLLLLDDESDALWNQRLLPTDKPETELRRIDLAAALKEAEAHRPEVAEASARVEERGVDLELARSRILPQVDLVASYARRGLAGD